MRKYQDMDEVKDKMDNPIKNIVKKISKLSSARFLIVVFILSIITVGGVVYNTAKIQKLNESQSIKTQRENQYKLIIPEQQDDIDKSRKSEKSIKPVLKYNPTSTPIPTAIPTVTKAQSTSAPSPAPTSYPNPKIDSVTPSSGIVGQSITIKGSNFGSESGFVIFCIYSSCSYGAPIESWSDTEIKAVVPGLLTLAIDHPFYVRKSNNIESDKFLFKLTAGQPIVDSISPLGVKPGEELVIKGSGFGSQSGQVNFYRPYPALAGAGNIVSWSESEIRLTIPSNFEAGAEYGVQIVITSGSSSSFKYYTLGAN